MHEMSIIAGVLKIVEDQAHAAGAQVVNVIELEIGQLAGIEVDSLRFCFDAAKRNTLAEKAELVIHDIPGLGRCPECGREGLVDFPVAVCGACGKALMTVSQGQELRVKCINVD